MILDTDSINNKIKSGLYVVSTPIGNLSDITLRALEVLKKSDYILCEDTRTSKNLLDRYEIKSKLISNHKFNEKKNLFKIIEILKSDCIVSLISDAGTPSISDPGAVLINECLINKINIYPIPGSSAVSSAVSISGFSEKYYFYGFFPEKNKKLKEDPNFPTPNQSNGDRNSMQNSQECPVGWEQRGQNNGPQAWADPNSEKVEACQK